LHDLNVAHFDAAAVVIGENMEASILATANVKELGVPFVVARALDRLHARVLQRVGADRIIEPEKDMGAQLARTMASSTVMDYVDLGEDEALAEPKVPTKWVGKSLANLHLYRKSGLTILALERKESGGTIPSGDTVLQEGDVLVIGDPRRTWTSSWRTPSSSGRNGPTLTARTTAEGGAALSACSPEDRRSSVHMDAVRKLELRYRYTTLGKADLVVEFVGGRIKVFEVDRFLIERLLEQLEDRER